MDFITPKLTTVFLALLSMSSIQACYSKLNELPDQALSEVSGQSLFSMSYIAPNDTGNRSGLRFYTMGLEGTIELNANINKLQLGCGGVNGAGQCDIDLDQVRLMGTQPGPSGTYVDSDAILENPFIQFAIKNPNNASTRHCRACIRCTKS